jgi:hypothetical protein
VVSVEWRSIDSVKPYEKNPRKNDGKATDVVARSIKLYGFQSPIIADENGVIVAGHTRWKAAKKLGMQTVPVVDAKKDGKWLSEAECRAYRIADNKTNEFAEWDDDLLHIELEAIRIDMPEFDAEFMAGTFGAEPNFDIPDSNKNIDEDAMSNTEHECPKCGFKW